MVCFVLMAATVVWFVCLAKGRIQTQLVSVGEPCSYFFSMLYSKKSAEREQNKQTTKITNS